MTNATLEAGDRLPELALPDETGARRTGRVLVDLRADLRSL